MICDPDDPVEVIDAFRGKRGGASRQEKQAQDGQEKAKGQIWVSNHANVSIPGRILLLEMP